MNLKQGVMSGILAGALLFTQSTQAAVKTFEEAQAQQLTSSMKIVINVAAKSLALYQNGTKIRLYPLGLGKVNTPTPVGYYDIDEKEINPSWVDPKNPENAVYSGPNNPLGYRWMRFSGYYGIHGTNNESSIGHYVSNGCVRMKENDVEDLYNLVPMNTPLEIFYNRVVVEKTTDDMVVFYVYPDGYGRQPLNVAMVNEWLKGYGVDTMVSDEEISEKINASDGTPTYTVKSYELFVNGNPVTRQAVLYNNEYYLPAIAVAEAIKLPLFYDRNLGVVRSKLGQAPVVNFKDVLYIRGGDVAQVFGLAGGMYHKTYALATI